jgi:hypothetical protein
MRGKESLPGAGRRCLAVSLAVLWRRPVAVSWLTDGGSKQQRRCSVFSVFPWPSQFGFFFQVFNSSFLFLCFDLLFFFFFPSLSSLGLFFWFSLLSVLPFFGSPSPFLPLSLLCSWVYL